MTSDLDHRRDPWDLRLYHAVRRRRDQLARPLCVPLATRSVPPWAVSLAGVALAATLPWSLPRSAAAASIVLLAALLCDALDGALARQSGVASAVGKVVDHACDTGTFVVVLWAVVRADPGSAGGAVRLGLLTVPLLGAAIVLRGRVAPRHGDRFAGGMPAHLHKAPIYLAVLGGAFGGAELYRPALAAGQILALASTLALAGCALGAARRAPWAPLEASVPTDRGARSALPAAGGEGAAAHLRAPRGR